MNKKTQQTPPKPSQTTSIPDFYSQIMSTQKSLNDKYSTHVKPILPKPKEK